MKKKTALGVGIIGGAMGGMVSALISSPQTQLAFWHKDKANRANILFWDFVALFAVLLVLGIVWKKKALIWGSLGVILAGIIISWYARKHWGGLKDNQEVPQPY